MDLALTGRYQRAVDRGEAAAAEREQQKTAFTEAEWRARLGRACCLWPSRATTVGLAVTDATHPGVYPQREEGASAGFHLSSVISTGRFMKLDYWRQNVPPAVKDALFFDARPNPHRPRRRAYATHAKVCFADTLGCAARGAMAGAVGGGGGGLGGGLGGGTGSGGGDDDDDDDGRTLASVIYVGSHNFSKNAWGCDGKTPGNVELGVVLGTRDPALRDEWASRLPCELPDAEELSRTCAARLYFPATGFGGLRELLQKGKCEQAEDVLRKQFTAVPFCDCTLVCECRKRKRQSDDGEIVVGEEPVAETEDNMLRFAWA